MVPILPPVFRFAVEKAEGRRNPLWYFIEVIVSLRSPSSDGVRSMQRGRLDWRCWGIPDGPMNLVNRVACSQSCQGDDGWAISMQVGR